MDLDSGRIWDYSTDSYVHRLVQDKLDAKPSTSKQSFWEKPDHGDEGTEFEELLATQLESQRLYYEGQVKTAIDRAARSSEMERELKVDYTRLQTDLNRMQLVLNEMKRAASAQQDVVRLAEAKSKTLSALARKAELQYKEEKSINSSLMEKLTYLELQQIGSDTAKAKLEVEVAEMKEHLRDIMIHLSGREEIDKHEDLKDAQVRTISPASTPTTNIPRSP